MRITIVAAEAEADAKYRCIWKSPIEFVTQSYHRHDFPCKGNISHRIDTIIQEKIGAKKRQKNGTQCIQFILLDKIFIEPGEKERTMNTKRQQNKMRIVNTIVCGNDRYRNITFTLTTA